MKIFGYNIPKEKTVELAAAPKKKKASLSQKIIRTDKPKVEVEMENLKSAIVAAENIEAPNRQLLYSTYLQIMEESHLSSQIRTAQYTILQSDFQVLINYKISDEHKLLFDKGWFSDFVKHVIDQEFWGHSLIEFGEIEDNEFKNVLLIDRFHVVPEFQSVKIKTNDEIDDASFYGNNLINLYLIEVGDKYDLGILRKAAREIIWKTYARSDWSLATEKYGMPLLSINTDTSDETELDELENMAQNFGSNGYVIGSKETDITIVQPDKGTQFYINYERLAKFCDIQISKLINGQVATSDEKAYVGSAEVQERILNTYTKGRLQRVERVINDKLIPFLIEHGYKLESAKFQFLDLLKKEPKPTVTDTETEKKKPESKLTTYNLSSDLFELYSSFKQDNNAVTLASSDKLKSIFDKLTERIYKAAGKAKIPKNSMLINEAEDMIKETALIFEKALNEGLSLSPFKPDQAFTEKLTKSVWVFSGFKTERQLKDISGMLIGPDGKLKAFNKFRDDVLNIHENYNVNWLNTEYNQAVSASQTAVQWKQFEEAGNKYYLQYRTAGDERVRSSHAVLNKITLPINDSFWNEHYPPNGWGCRCLVKQVLKSQHEETSQEDVKSSTDGFFKGKEKIFAYNPGKQTALFPEKHPYFSNSNAGKIAELKQARYIASKALPVLKKALKNKTIKLKEASTPISFTTKGIKEAFNQPHKFPVEKAYAVSKIERLLKDAEYIRFDKDIKGVKTIKGFHYLKITINNEDSFIVLREHANGTIDFYSIVEAVKSK